VALESDRHPGVHRTLEGHKQPRELHGFPRIPRRRSSWSSQIAGRVMAKGTRTTNKALVEKWGKVRVENHRNGFRVREYDRALKTTVDRGYFKDLVSARDLAQTLAHQAAVAGPVKADAATIAVLGEKVLHPDRYPRWGTNHRVNQISLFRTHIVPTLGHRLARDVTATDIGALLNSLAVTGMSQSMIDKVLKFMRAVAREAIAAGIWNPAQNPMTGMQAPRAAGRGSGLHTITKADVPTKKEVAALRKEMAKKGAMYAVMCDIASHCGLRFGELLALRPSDIDIKQRTISVTRQIREVPKGFEVAVPKTAAGRRTVVIPKVIVANLDAFLKGKPKDGLLFVNSKGGYIRRSNWSAFLGGKKYKDVQTTGVYQASNWPQHLTWHSLRHFAATSWIQAGVTIVDVSEMMGHADPSITMRIYVGGDKEAYKRAASIM
jgi:integrase